jgi:uncharacterized membrane protein
MRTPPRWPAVLVVIGSLLGLAFAVVSTLDYANHLDRQLHGLSCSFIPGVAAEKGADVGCKAAMYSPYSALFRDRYWGGVPISLFAVGAFSFFAGFGSYLVMAGAGAPRRALRFVAATGVTPALVSLGMAFISASQLGHFCKTCVGMYISSALLALGAIACWWTDRNTAPLPDLPDAGLDPTDSDFATVRRPQGQPVMLLTWLGALGLFSALPGLVYVESLPSFADHIKGCGTLEVSVADGLGKDAVVLEASSGGVPATMLVDPLCPTCKALHQRLDSEGYMQQLETSMVLFPLDSECNWMLDNAMHPGSCEVSKAVLCAGDDAHRVLEWSYQQQDWIMDQSKGEGGADKARALVAERWPKLAACAKTKETAKRLDKHLRFAIDNKLPVSTPQLFIGKTQLCDEDSDIGLAYTLRRLEPRLGSGG